MARKTTENTTTNRRKKTQIPDPPAVMQATPEVQPQIHAQIPHEEFRKDAPKNGTSMGISAGTPANQAPVSLASENIEELIRRRAYELYLQRRTTAGARNGDQNQDWLIAEREIRSLHGRQKRFSAVAGGVRA